MPTVTVGFSARERFSTGAMCLKSIFDNTEIPFTLILVDCNMPQRYRDEMMAVIGDRKSVRIIRAERHLLPNESKNLIVQASQDDYVCLTDMDTLAQPGWLSNMVTACEEWPADVCVPLIEELSGDVHFDERLGSFRLVQTADGEKLTILPRKGNKQADKHAARRSIEMIENHCVLYKRSVFDKTGPLDGELTTRIEVDLSIQLWKAKVPIVFEPRARVTFMPPPAVQPDERDFYLFKWDWDRALRSHERVEQRWNVVSLPNSMNLVERRQYWIQEIDPAKQAAKEKEYFDSITRRYQEKIAAAVREIDGVVPAAAPMILADEEQIRATDHLRSRRTLPFTEHEGKYWGPPQTDEQAVAEFERLRGKGADFAVFGWPAFWWLDYYKDLGRHVKSKYACVLETERVKIFDLRPGARASTTTAAAAATA